MRPSNIVRDTQRVTWIALLTNIALSALKLIGGTVGRSQAVVADGIHSLSDTATDIAILVGVKFWSAPPDACHPHGHKRIETMVSAVIGLILFSVGVGLVYDSLSAIYDKEPRKAPGWIAFAVTLAAIVVKEILFRYSIRVGQRIGSPAVIANAWHQRSDVLSSIPAALAVLAAKFFPSWRSVDYIGAVVVSVFIFQAAVKIVAPALKQLVDTGAPAETRNRITEIAAQISGVINIHAVRTRYMGSGLQVDLHVEVDGNQTVREGHDIAGEVKHRLLEEGPDVADVIVHIEPAGNSDPA